MEEELLVFAFCVKDHLRICVRGVVYILTSQEYISRSEAKCASCIIMSSIEFVMVSWFKGKISVLESLFFLTVSCGAIKDIMFPTNVACCQSSLMVSGIFPLGELKVKMDYSQLVKFDCLTYN